MKKIFNISLIACVLVIAACGEDDEPTKEEKFLKELSGTWQVEEVTLDNMSVTEEFETMKITFKKDQTFTVQNPEGNIWPASGTFTLEDGTGTNFDLMRDDGVEIGVVTLDEANLVLTMTFSEGPGVRTRDLAGAYEFSLSR